MSNVKNRGLNGLEGGEKPPSVIHRGDLLVTVVILAICAFLYWQTTTFETPPSILGDFMLPQEFPRILIGTIAILALLLPFEHHKAARRGGSMDEDRSERVQPIAYVTTAFMIAMVALMPWLGTIVTAFVISAGMPLLWGERRYLRIVMFAVLLPAGVYILFERIFQVRLIYGLLRPLYY